MKKLFNGMQNISFKNEIIMSHISLNKQTTVLQMLIRIITVNFDLIRLLSRIGFYLTDQCIEQFTTLTAWYQLIILSMNQQDRTLDIFHAFQIVEMVIHKIAH
jgi:hypothetical protein